MLKFVFGESGSGKSEYIIDSIENELKNTYRNVILLVPEQQTVMSETKLSRRIPGMYMMRLEVTNFTRLADTVARRVGGLSYSQLTPGAKKLVLWRAVMSVWESLLYLNKTASGNETRILPMVSSAIKEITASGISPEELLEASDKAESESLSDKAHDLALICTAYRSILAEEFSEITEPLAALKNNLGDSGILDNTSVYLDSFFSLTGAERSVMNEILRFASNVTVTLPMADRDEIGVHLYAARHFYRELEVIGARYGEIENITLTANRRAKTAELALTDKYLWKYEYDRNNVTTPSDLPSDKNSVRIFTVRDRYEEGESAAGVIESLIRSGAKYSEIAVVAADVNRLRGITDTAMRNRGIPVFLSEPSKIISSPIIRLIVSLLKIPGKWGRDDIIRAVKTGLLPITEKDTCAFEAYTEAWNIRGRRMFSASWNMNPAGYVEKIDERGQRTLESANRVRDIIVPPIERFCSVFTGGKAPVSEICTAVVNISEEFGIPEALKKRADYMEANGSRDDGAKERLIWKKFCFCLDTMVDVLGNTELSTSSFASLLSTVASEVDAGAIPTCIDEVTFASASSLRGDNIKHIIVLGAVEGEFPASPATDKYFTEGDRNSLIEMGVTLGTSADEMISEELYRFYHVISRASDSLTIFVPKDSFSADTPPSGGVERIEKLLDIKSVPYSSLPSEERIFSPGGLESNILYGVNKEERLLSARLYKKLTGNSSVGAPVRECESVAPELAEKVFGRNLSLSQSKIKKFIQCPFAYYAKNVLKLETKQKIDIAPVDIGNFVHAILCEFFMAVKDKELPLPKDEAESLCDEIIQNYLAGIFNGDEPDGRLKYMFVRLKRQVRIFVDEIMNEVAQSDFTVYRTELPVGMSKDDQTPPPVTFTTSDGSQVSLHGITDRLDVYKSGGKTYVRVIDYKTGTHDFSYDDVKLGLDVQLLLYLFAAWKCGPSPFGKEMAAGDEIIPAGAVFLSIKPSDLTAESYIDEESAHKMVIDKNISRSGVFLNDLNVLYAMDRDLSGKYVPIKSVKTMTVSKSSELATLERFGEMYGDLNETITKIAERMKSGEAAVKPLLHQRRHPCRYCEYSSFCKNKTYINETF